MNLSILLRIVQARMPLTLLRMAPRVLLLFLLWSPLGSAAPHQFSLPSQPLSDALLAYAALVPDVRLVFRPEQLAGLTAGAVIGQYEPVAALEMLLAGQPLRKRELEPNTYLLEPLPVATVAPSKAAVARQSRDDVGADAADSLPIIEELVTIGTRSRTRKLLQSTVPIDIVHGYSLSRSAPASLGEQLQSQAPSFNFSRTMVSDGADLVRPATMRGMNPDQLLVMINGKRRHHQAQINIQQVVGRGSSGVDMNAIPTVMLERVEVLRDGASALYGSDAIAGVLNLVLKSGQQDPELNVQYGQTHEGDGQSLISSLAGGFDLGADASAFIALEVQDRAATNRAAPDQRFEPARVSMRIGDTEQQSWNLFGNGQWALSEQLEVYGFGGSARRAGLSAGFYRGAGASDGTAPVSARYLPGLDPEGFLPLQSTRSEDDSVALGAVIELPEAWSLDISSSWGENRFIQGTDYSVNVSLGEQTPTSATNGELKYSQLQHAVVASGLVDASGLEELLVTGGAEWRRENYQITTGEFASYAYGPEDDFSLFIPSPIDPCPTETGLVCADGQARSRAQAGMQAYPGYRLPVSDQRDSMAWFVEAEIDFDERLAIALASRWESFGDVGRTLNGKLSLRYQLTRALMLRGGVASGFRAPGINQRSFTHVITNIGPDVLTNTLHAAEDSEVLEALGVAPLAAERSKHASIGAIWQPVQGLSLSLDGFHIDVADAIALSDVIAAEPGACLPNCAFAQALAAQGNNIGAVQFMYNAMDTVTTGFDLVARYQWRHDWGQTQLSLLGHYNRTRVLTLHGPQGFAPSELYSDAQVMLTEQGQPRRRLLLSADWQYASWSTSVRLNRFGSVKTSYFTEAGLGVDLPDVDETFHKSGRAWLLDADISYRFNGGFSISLGGNNLLNTYPEPLAKPSLLGEISGNSFVYPWESSPYGINGAFYYARAVYQL
ncbi:TonB-dependent receptor [Simiduia curdlanivorans]|uniref:TonB-dependent receptor domain-containing protein n=1 Tax=Simiduia curdlanivorans TaxID=1492769 RepID=A0ABV8UYV5_9GAMM|nr:TonB-dependent receptor [Simiduia curdlanivorans]MDN3640487.1 TonB-dependent receptor [Simiduia curdlanivorans]